MDSRKIGNLPLDKEKPIVAIVNMSKFDGQWARVIIKDSSGKERSVDIEPGIYARFNTDSIVGIEDTPWSDVDETVKGERHVVNGKPGHVQLSVGFRSE